MAIFEVESWFPLQGKEAEHEAAMKDFLQWVNAHRSLFKEWKSLRYFIREIAGSSSGRHFIVWEYDDLASFEAYKKRRKDYSGEYAEYKLHDPYHLGVMDHRNMELEIWYEDHRSLWLT
ncbi:hypothetical protein [Sphingopyxis fribergensis]|jgi:hypothetical protein